VALTRHWDTCNSNPGIFSFLWPFSVIPYCLLQFLGLQFQFARLDNSKAAEYVAIRPSVLMNVKPYKYFRPLFGDIMFFISARTYF